MRPRRYGIGASSGGACGRLARALGRFNRDQSGASAIVFSLSFGVLIFIVALAIDYGRASMERMQMQSALDAAALAAAHQLGQPDQDEKARAVAESFFRVNSPAGSEIDSMEFDADKGEVRMTAAGASLTSILNAFGIRKLALGAASKVSKGDGTLELALVLDNSGSMAGQPIIDLRTAATNLLDTVFAGANGDKVKAGIVPFAGSVNVGAGMRDSGWIDTDGLSPLHFQNFSEHKTRFDLLSQMDVAWGGCVEARPSPYDVQDTVPNAATPETLFVPMFAPDEPDAENDNGSNYPNNYLDDFGGSCPAPEQICTHFSTRKNKCTQYGPQPLDPATAQARTCKYDHATPSGAGPNANCTTKPIQPLTSDKTEAENSVDLMQANGNTDIPEGLMWGWRVLSPEAPFTEGRGWDDQNNRKIIVLMTDGENTYQTYSNQNKSSYGAFGYAVKDRLGTSYSQSSIVSKMDAKTASACTNAKAKGITIYTVAFRLSSGSPSLPLLQGCASGSDKAYRADDGDSLIQVFQTIGREIAQLRVSS